MKKYYPSIQALRGILFLLILAFHCGVPYADFGWGGVEAFFVISAFFLVWKHWETDVSDLKHQFKHRIKRLYPPYIAVLFIAVLYALLVKEIPYDLLSHILSAQNFQWMITDYRSAMQPMTAHTWTLSIEVWGGLFWIFLLSVVQKKYFRYVMYGMILLSISYRVFTIAGGADAWIVSLCPIAHFDAFACGSLLAIGARENKLQQRAGILGITGIAGIVACIAWISVNNHISFVQAYLFLSSSKNYLNNWFTGNIYIYISLFATGLVGLLCRRDERRAEEPKRVEKLFALLGDNSYTLYLFHWPVLVVIRRFVGTWAITLPVTLIVSIAAIVIFNKLYFKIQKKLAGG